MLIVLCQDHGAVRLVGGDVDSEGTVEVYSESMGWGTVCDRDWSDNDGHVVCRQLGKDNASEVSSIVAKGSVTKKLGSNF